MVVTTDVGTLVFSSEGTGAGVGASLTPEGSEFVHPENIIHTDRISASIIGSVA